ncbi:MAG TPA: DUF4230 domain-containing protein [Patescibacteria group bacterium]|nr:DUF4230 domain-containing protein [Patescibacteria group bacterium]
MKKYLYLIAILVFVGLGIYAGYVLFAPKDKEESINSQVILNTLRQEGFLVTQTYIFNQQVTINRNTGSVFKDFFWGQDITASALMKVGSGIDLTKIDFNNIQVEPERIVVRLPNVEEHSVELLGDITLTNKQGVLKKVFDDDDGYNAAFTVLKEEARKTAASDLLRNEAKTSAQKEITRLVRLVDGSREVVVEFSQ